MMWKTGGFYIMRNFMIYRSPDIFRVLKSRRLRWTEIKYQMAGQEVHTGCLWKNLLEKDHLED
jgi:hypothetical protein